MLVGISNWFGKTWQRFSLHEFQFVVSVLGILLNMYLVAGFLLFKELRQLQFFLIVVQACSDIVGNGLGGILLYISEINVTINWSFDYYDYGQNVS